MSAAAAGTNTGVPTTPAVGTANGWTDGHGFVFSIDSNKLLCHLAAGASNTNAILYRDVSEAIATSRVVVRIDNVGFPSIAWNVVLGYVLSSNSSYQFALNFGSSPYVAAFTNGAFVANQSPIVPLIAYDATHVYEIDGSLEGTNPTVVTVTVTDVTLGQTYWTNASTPWSSSHSPLQVPRVFALTVAASESKVIRIQGYQAVASSAVTPTVLPSNHNGTITVAVTGTGTTFSGSTTWTASGVAGWSVSSKNFVDTTHYTVVLSGPTSASPPSGTTGTLALTEGVTGSTIATVTIATPTLALNPTTGTLGTTPTLSTIGSNTLWSTETPAGLFTVSGGTGASLATPTVTANTTATDVLTVGTGAGTLTLTDTSTGAQATFAASGSPTATVTEQNLPANHNGTLAVHVVGALTTFSSSTTWTASGVAGWSVSAKTFVNATHYTLTLSCPAVATPPVGATGTLTLTESVTGTTHPTVTVGTPTLAISPTVGNIGSLPTLALTGQNARWTIETAAGLFAVSGGTGASVGTPFVSGDGSASVVLAVGSATGTLTILDTSTGATATFTAQSTSTLTSGFATASLGTPTTTSLHCTVASGGTAPYTYQWYYSFTSAFVGLGTLIPGATSLDLTHAPGVAPGVRVYYKLESTDSIGAKVYTGSTPGQCAHAPLVIAFLGDSIADILNNANAMQLALAALIPNRSITVLNHGHSGATTLLWQAGSAYLNAAIADMLASGATHCMIDLGTNDAINGAINPTSGTGATPIQYHDRLLSTLQALVPAVVPQVVIHAPGGFGPRAASGGWEEASNDRLKSYVAVHDGLIDGTTYLQGDRRLAEVLVPLYGNNSYLATDDTHPASPGGRDLFARIKAESAAAAWGLLAPVVGGGGGGGGETDPFGEGPVDAGGI